MKFANAVIFVSKKLIMEDGKKYFDNYFVTVKAVNDDALVVVKSNGEEEGYLVSEKRKPKVYRWHLNALFNRRMPNEHTCCFRRGQ